MYLAMLDGCRRFAGSSERPRPRRRLHWTRDGDDRWTANDGVVDSGWPMWDGGVVAGGYVGKGRRCLGGVRCVWGSGRCGKAGGQEIRAPRRSRQKERGEVGRQTEVGREIVGLRKITSFLLPWDRGIANAREEGRFGGRSTERSSDVRRKPSEGRC